MHESLSDGHLNDVMEVLDIQSHEEVSVIQRACRLWTEVYGRPRLAGRGKRSIRQDAGRKRIVCESAGTPSEAGFLRKRYRQVSEAAGQPALASSAKYALGADDWSAKHEAEAGVWVNPILDFRKSLAYQNLVAAELPGEFDAVFIVSKPGPN